MRKDLTGAHTLGPEAEVATLTVLRLPPGFEAVMGEGGDHVLDGVADGVVVLIVHPPGVAHKAVGLLLMNRLCMFRAQIFFVLFFII